MFQVTLYRIDRIGSAEERKVIMYKRFGIIAAVILIGIGLWATYPKTILSVLRIETDSIEACSIIRNGDSGASITLDKTQLNQLVSLLTETNVIYKEIDPSIWRPINSIEYLVYLEGSGKSVSITDNGFLYYKGRKYQLPQKQGQEIIALLENVLQ